MNVKHRRVVLALMACVGLGAISARAALLGEASGFTSPSSGDPFQYNFTTYGLQVANSVSQGVSYFSASSLFVNNGDHYTTPFSQSVTSFSGTFDLNATLVQEGGTWYVQSGTVGVYGNLAGHATGDLLLSGSLLAGPEADANGRGAFGYAAHTFEFIFAVTGGDPGIVGRFFGVGALNNVFITVPAWQSGAAFDGTSAGLASNFESLGSTAFGDTYVPEPRAYGLAASGLALAALVSLRRRFSAL